MHHWEKHASTVSVRKLDSSGALIICGWTTAALARTSRTPAFGCVLLSLPATTADYTVKALAGSTDPVLQESWGGWGTSLCWWANVFGAREDIADALFTLNESVTLDGATAAIPGLGLNIARYNIGGSSNNVIDDGGTEVAMNVSPNMPRFKFMESFWLDWRNADATSGSWNWDADPHQRAMLQFATVRGANVLEAFVNSPPWWMNYNYATAGGEDGRYDNLQAWNYDTFVYYLATVVHKAKTEWGITFNYVEPFNEPSATWWAFPGKQEGCHFSWKTQHIILPLLRKQLDALELQDVGIASSDENSPSMSLSTLQNMSTDPHVTAAFGKVNTHGYQSLDAYRGPARPGLRDETIRLDKILWDSEYGEKDATGLTMAESICLDINEMGVVAFVYWQALDGGGWGLILSRPGDKWIGPPNPKYYVLAQYSRHIRPGMMILATDDAKTVLAYDVEKDVLVLVTVNTGDAQTITYDLNACTKVIGPIKAWTTETSGTGAFHTPSIVELSGKFLSAAFPAKSVITFEIEGVELDLVSSW
ncbi:hypothetical protein PsorP6_007155 [Peronosclerospora sorghi]|uniref:Uncharacterized protein n=1 Tax=Peronosclerospora sorghi TaxID=230839 RepID=A0ACC0W9X8_9STRA|nr:hypothetical protein PsorP6_007155 [Peronosclerospora sorghi]